MSRLFVVDGEKAEPAVMTSLPAADLRERDHLPIRPAPSELSTVVDGLLGAPAYRFWLLLRGDEAVAVLDTGGRLHQRERDPVGLMPIYRDSGRRLTSTVGAALRHLLP